MIEVTSNNDIVSPLIKGLTLNEEGSVGIWVERLALAVIDDIKDVQVKLDVLNANKAVGLFLSVRTPFFLEGKG